MMQTWDAVFLLAEGMRAGGMFVACATLFTLGVIRWRSLRGYTGLYFAFACNTGLNGVRGALEIHATVAGHGLTAAIVACTAAQAGAAIFLAAALALAFRELLAWQSPAQWIAQNQRLAAHLQHADFRTRDGGPLDPVELAAIRADIRAAREEIEGALRATAEEAA